MIEPIRLLAFAFAGADLLFEIDRTGTILFATGATSGFTDAGHLEGLPAADLFLAGERARFSIIARGLTPGERAGPLPMTLASGEKASLAMCYLPQRDRIACTLVRPGNRSAFGTGTIDTETGLAGKEAFLAAAAKSAGGNGALALVNLPGLSDACAKLSPPEASSLMASIGQSMTTMGAVVASRLSETGFGVVAADADTAGGLAKKILSTVHENGLDTIQAEEVLLSLKGRNLSPEQSILALRYVVGRFAGGKLKNAPGADLSAVFETVMNETLVRAQAFHTTVADGAFDLVFEPIVNLRTGGTTYYEALTRFQPGESPAETICFAEDLGIANSLDLAVAVKAFNHLERDPEIAAGIAINMSGPSVVKPSSFAMLAGLLAKKRALAKRVRIEITETAEILDLAAADNAIQALRQMGYRVGIDDFGSGAASLQYLHNLTVDFVKIDGSLIRRLGKSTRDDALIKGVLASCKELHVDTVAEWIDSTERLNRCTDMGFGYGQGRQFGDALSELPREPSLPPVRARRMGVRETWE